MKENKVKHFFKPTWKKFILPLVFVVLFFVLISNFNAIGTFLDKYSCESEALYTKYDQNKRTNNTEDLNQTETQIKELGQRMVQDAPRGGIVPIISLYTIGVIDPVIPFPCLMIEGESPFCQFYVNETTHACMVKSIENTKLEDFNITALRDIKFAVKPYAQSSPTTLIVNIILLIIEGYLLSVLIQFVYTKQKNKKSVHKETK